MEKIKFMNPKISVIIPCYNLGEKIKPCLNSVINQSFKDIEIIVVNDGSTDDSLQVIQKFKDDRIVIVNKENGGLPSARKAGFDVAKGEYISHIDGDDEVLPNFLESLYKGASENNADLVLSDAIFIRDGIESIHKDSLQSGVVDKKKYLDDILNARYDRVLTSVVNKLYKKTLHDRVEFPVDIRFYAEDRCIIPKIAFFAEKIYKVDDTFYRYYLNRKQMTFLKLKDNFIVNESLTNFFTKQGFNDAETIFCKDSMRVVFHYFFISTPFDKNDIKQTLKEYKNKICEITKSSEFKDCSLEKYKKFMLSVLIRLPNSVILSICAMSKTLAKFAIFARNLFLRIKK